MRLASLTTDGNESSTFKYPRHAVLQSVYSVLQSCIDMPSLSTVVLNDAFQHLADYTVSSELRWGFVMCRYWTNGSYSLVAVLYKECKCM